MMVRGCTVGRLVELRALAPDPGDFDDASVEDWVKLLKSVARPVVCVDLRKAHVLPPKLADRLTLQMERTKGLAERTANIFAPSTSPTLVMQLERIARDAGDPNRRIFTDPQAAVRWLDEVLTPLERTRLRVFLFERP